MCGTVMVATFDIYGYIMIVYNIILIVHNRIAQVVPRTIFMLYYLYSLESNHMTVLPPITIMEKYVWFTRLDCIVKIIRSKGLSSNC